MIRSQREYKRAMRKMIRRIQSGEEIDSWRESSEDMEILADCILAGYVNGELKGKHSEPWMVKSTLLCSILIFL